MSRMSTAPREFGGVPCLNCGKAMTHGAYFAGPVEVTLCSDCARLGDLRAFGILLGDAVVDAYHRNLPRDRDCNPTQFARDILLRLELQLYRAIALGLWRERTRSA
jgi:hypothetical protein